MWHPDIPLEYRNQIITGDVWKLGRRIPDDSIDFILTDPPYSRKYIYLYRELAQLSARVLKQGGQVMALCGHFYLPEIFQMMGDHLDYVWLAGMGHSGPTSRVWSNKTWAAWKPLLWYSKGKPKRERWVSDFYRSVVPDKRYHKWGQPVEHSLYYIDRMTEPDDVILEPFTGGGTVPVACKVLGRNYIGFEIDANAAKIARERVKNTNPPLFVVEHKQAEFKI